MKSKLLLLFAFAVLGIFLINLISSASWTADLNNNLRYYYKEDQLSGNNTDSLGLLNMSMSGTVTNVSGIIKSGKSGSESNYYYGTQSGFDGNTVTYNVWFKSISAGNGIAIIDNSNFGSSLAGARAYVDGSIVSCQVNDAGYGPGANYAWTYDNNWHMLTCVFNDPNIEMWLDGVNRANQTWDGRSLTESNNLRIMSSASASFTGTLSTDEIGIWNRTLTPTEITQLYNGGAGITYTVFPTVTLNSPINYYNSSSSSIVFNWTANTPTAPITNTSLYVNGSLVTTQNTNGTQTYIYNTNDGTYSWYADEYVSGTRYISPTNYFTIDTTPPTINITNPYPNNSVISYQVSNENMAFNWTVNDAHLSSCWINYAGTNHTVTCSANTTNINLTSVNINNATFYANDSAGNIASLERSWNYKVFQNSITYNPSTYETATEIYSINLTANSSLTGVSLIYNGTTYSATNEGNGIYNTSVTIPIGAITNNVSWIFTYGGNSIDSNIYPQTVNTLTLSYCTSGTKFVTYNFKDEANASSITAEIPTSTFSYYLGDGSITKTLTYINVSQQASYSFCLNTNRTLYTDVYIQYAASGYPQRTYNPDTMTYTNSTTTTTLYLLSSTEGQYVTYQVINSADQVLTGVNVNAKRLISGSNVTIGTGITASDGTVTFWLNPNFYHWITFSKTGFNTYALYHIPTQTSYTITLIGGTVNYSDYTQGIQNYFNPDETIIYNDTIYNFQYNLTSSFWDVSSYGFDLRLANGTIVGSDSTTGTSASYPYNVSNQTIIYMDYWYLINGTYTNGTNQWTIFNTNNTGFSIINFINDLKTYSMAGMFGIDNFGIKLLYFIVMFLSVGIMSYKFGFGNPMTISVFVFAVTFFFDFVTGLITTTMGLAHLPTYIAGLILILSIFREIQT